MLLYFTLSSTLTITYDSHMIFVLGENDDQLFLKQNKELKEELFTTLV